MDKEKEIYIVVSRTNTLLGYLIRKFTRFNYNHVSVSLSDSLQPLFSFARYYNNEPFVGGFVEESWLRYLYYGKDVHIKVYCIGVTQSEYNEVKDRIRYMNDNRDVYKYDLFGLYKKSQSKNRFTCLSFVISILTNLDIIISLNKVNSIKRLCNCIEDYYQYEKVIYIDNQSEFKWGNDRFYIKRPIYLVIMDTIKHINGIIFKE